MTGDDMQWLRDRIEIEEAAMRYGRALDARDGSSSDLFDSCLHADVEVEYPFGSWRGIDAMKLAHETGLKKLFPMTHHVLTNPLIEIDGDRATAQYYVSGAHSVPTDDGEQIVWGGSLYDQELVRTPAGWRITRHRCHREWIADDGSLMAAVDASTAT